LTPQRWSQIRKVFGAAVETPEPERPQFLGSACGQDTELRGEVGAILDTKSGRSAATMSAPEEARRLLEIIRDGNLSVQISGHRRYGATTDLKPPTCVPEVIWATENPIRP
jgi:hypothetical protein